jgi:WD40 repeat protein
MPAYETVSCPNCRRALNLPERVLGRPVCCPLCQTTFAVRLEGGSWVTDVESIPVAALPAETETPGATPPRRSTPRDSELEPLPLPATPRAKAPAKGAAPAVRFEVRVEYDPDERLEGDFHAEIDLQGLHLWRGNGRVLHAPRGDGARHLGRDRMRVFLEGRWVQIRVRTRAASAFTLALVDFLNGRTQTIAAPGREVPLSLLLVLPILLIGFAGPLGGWRLMLLVTPLAGVLVGMTALLLYAVSASRGFRALLAVGLNGGLGVAILLTLWMLQNNPHSSTPPHLWGIVPRHDQGFLVKMPGVALTLEDQRLECFTAPRAGTLLVNQGERRFRVFYGEFWPPLDSPGQPTREAKWAEIERSLERLFGPVQKTAAQHGNPVQQHRYQTRQGTMETHVRAILVRQRAVILVAQGRPNADFEQFLNSLELLGEDWLRPIAGLPDPAVPGDARVVAPEARLLHDPDPAFFWAGFHSTGQGTGRVMGLHTQRGLIDVERSPTRSEWPATVGVVSAACVPGSPLYLVGNGKAVAFERLPGELPLFLLTEETPVSRGAVALSADGKRLAVGLTLEQGVGKVHLWDTERQRRESVLEGFAAEVVRVALAPRGEVLAVAQADGSITIVPRNPTRERFVAQTRHGEGRPEDPPSTRSKSFRIAALCFAPDGARLLSIGADRTARLHHARNGRLLFEIALPAVPTSAAFSPSGRLFAVGAADGVIRVYDTLTGKPRAQLRDRREAVGEGPVGEVPAGEMVRHLAFSESGDALLAVTRRGIEQWDVARAVRPTVLERQPLPFNLLDGYLPGRVLRMVGSRERVVALLDDKGIHSFKTPELEREGEPFRLPGTQEADLIVTPDGRRCLVRCGLQLQILEMPSHRVLATRVDVDPARLVAMTPDGGLVVSVHASRLRLWDMQRPEATVRRPLPMGDQVQAIALHPTGERLALGRRDSPRIDWLDPRSGATLAHLVGHTAPVSQLALSPDGKTLASFAPDRTLRLWDTQTLRERGQLGIPSTKLSVGASLLFSDDSRTLILTQHDFSVVVDVPSARSLQTLPTPQSLGVALDGNQRLYLGMADCPLRVVNLQKPPFRDRPAIQIVPRSSAAPQLADLVPETMEPHLTLVGDRDKGIALAFTRDRLLFRLDLPALQTRDVFWTGQIIPRAALDPARGLLWAATVDLHRLETLDSPEKARGPVLVYDVRDLLDGKPCPSVLKPRGSLPLSGHFDNILVGADFAVLREQKGKERILHVVESKNLRLREPLVVPLDPTGPLALSPDGKTLLVTGLVAGKAAGVLVRVNLATREVTPPLELAQPIRDLAVTPHWLMVRTQPDPARGSILFLDEQNRELASWKEETPHSELLAVGTRLFGIVDRGRFTPREIPVGKVPPATRPAELARAGETLELDPPFVAPAQVLAGRWLVSASGHAYRLREAGIAPTPHLSPAGVTPLKQLGERTFRTHGRIHALQKDDSENLIVGLSTGAVSSEDRLTNQERLLGKGEGFPLAFAVHQRQAFLFRDRGTEGFAAVGKLTPRLLGGDRVVVAPRARLVYPGREGLMVTPLRGGALPETHRVPWPISALDADPSGVLACGDIRGTVRFLSPKQENFVRADGHEGEVRAILLGDSGRRAYSAGVDGKIHVWDIREGKRVHCFESHTHPVTCLALSADGKWLASGALDGTVILWDRTTGRKLLTLPGRRSEPIGGLQFRGEECIVAAGNRLIRYACPR